MAITMARGTWMKPATRAQITLFMTERENALSLNSRAKFLKARKVGAEMPFHLNRLITTT